MIKALVVEDEPPIQRMVKSRIEAADPGFVVGRCCMNGQSAIEALQAEHFDVVFTDIKMPVLGGIELARWVYENRPETLVVILSGYSDFEYARCAMQYKTFDYLLKPVSKAKAREITRRIAQEFAKRRGADHDQERNTVVMLACAGAYLLYGAEAMLPGENFWTNERIEKFMAENLDKGEAYISFHPNAPSERFLVVESDSHQRQQAIARRFYESLENPQLPITFLYKTGVPLKNAGKTFAYLRAQLIRSLVLDTSQILCCDDLPEVYENIEQPYSKQDIDAMTTAIKNGDMSEVRNQFSRILDAMRQANYTQEEVHSFLNVVLDTYALNYPRSMQRKTTSVKREFVNALAGFTGYAGFLDDVVSILMTLRRDGGTTDRYAQLAEDVEAYLVGNYNKNITSDVLSRKFGFVPSYISRIFKRQKGVSPNEYLTRYRIETAKAMMQENPDLKIKEVANLVGFKEAYYFSKTFKRETGFWPSEL